MGQANQVLMLYNVNCSDVLCSNSTPCANASHLNGKYSQMKEHVFKEFVFVEGRCSTLSFFSEMTRV